jgi:4-hydroxybenzoate polyprenyltransferase
MEGVRILTTAANVNQNIIRKVPLFLDAIKFQESIFALPFAYIGMFLAADGFPSWATFIWITVAMVSARTVGMAANRVIDREIDAKNPRAAARHLPAGLLKVGEMVGLTVIALIVFIFAASQLNTLALILAPVAAAYLIFYPYTKRFTWAANLMLGWVLAISPSAAWIGVQGSLSFQPVLISVAVAFWAGSFDILYHTQDESFHLKEGLHSVASRFGVVNAFRIARTLDTLAIAVLVTVGVWMDLSWPYFVGCVGAIGFLLYKYSLVNPGDLSRMGLAFARINAYISTTMLVGTLVAIYI